MNDIKVEDIIQTKNGNIYRVHKIDSYQKGWNKDLKQKYITAELLLPDPDRLHPPKGKSFVNCYLNSVQKVDAEYCLKQINHWNKVLSILHRNPYANSNQ